MTGTPMVVTFFVGGADESFVATTPGLPVVAVLLVLSLVLVPVYALSILLFQTDFHVQAEPVGSRMSR